MRALPYTFIFLTLSLVIIGLNRIGQDDKNILLIYLNPILNHIVYEEPYRQLIWNDGPTLYMYLAHLLTFLIFGGIIDLIRHLFLSKGN